LRRAGHNLRPFPPTVTHHAHCQQQGHGIGKPALDLMALVPELQVIENDATAAVWRVHTG
jgi:hypothetical protein